MSEPLWRWRELCAALDLPEEDGPDITGVSIDSRSMAPGELFIALTGDPGPRFNPSQRSDRDGHDFVDAAVAADAAGVLTHDKTPRAVPELKVADTLDALWDLGRAARARLGCPVVAVTGSSGKTTTKEFLGAALDAFRTQGSLNNHLGVPLSLARTPREAAAAVYEIGTNHPGEIAPLAKLAKPDVAIVLNVHPAHAEHFESMEALRSEKLSISEGLGKGGVLVVEDAIDDAEVNPAIRRIRFGATDLADVQLLACDGVSARYRFDQEEITAHVPGGGAHRAMSLAAVLAVHLALGRDPRPACRLSDALIPRGRGTEIQVGGITIVDDSYNANPESMRAAIQSLASRPGRRLALLGEMLELGDRSAEFHVGLEQDCRRLDGVFLVGERMRPLADKLRNGVLIDYRREAEGVIDVLLSSLKQADTLLIKGSNRIFWAKNFVQQLTDRYTQRDTGS